MKILAISDWHGKEKVLSQLASAIKGLRPEAIVFTGDILQWKAKCSEWANAEKENRAPQRDLPQIKEEIEKNAEVYATFYRSVKEFSLPFFSIPGNVDAPVRQFFWVAMDAMSENPNLRMVHPSLAVLGGFVIVGFGGEVCEKDEESFFVLRYPRHDLQTYLEILSFISGPKIVLTHTPPVGSLDIDDGKHKGSRAINDLIERFQPAWLFCGHAHGARGKESIGECMVVNPGALKNGFYALVDTDKRSVELKTL
jgi:Icc-related predicted phosphoesterase